MARGKNVLILMTMVMAAGVAQAGTITVSGYFNDNTNTALVWSDMGPAKFGDDFEIANNVAIYEITVPVAGLVTFESFGYGQGGAEPYFSLFQGTNPGAAWIDSSYFDPNIDFALTRSLVAGVYTVALGVWLNMSFAENNPDSDPTLGDGFIQLGEPGRLGDAWYEVKFGIPDAPIPEPATFVLVAAGLIAVGLRRLRG